METRAGDIRIKLPEKFDLGLVDASTHAGDVNAPFGKPHGWIGSKLDYNGGGKYRIHAHTLAGDIEFEQPKVDRADSGPGLNWRAIPVANPRADSHLPSRFWARRRPLFVVKYL